MPITIQNQPPAGIIGGAANLVGRGQYEERRRAERAKYYQLAQQERMQVRGLQAQDYFQNKQFAVQAQRDQMNAFVQQRRDERVGLMQEERDERLHKQQLDRFGQEQEMRLNTEGKAKEQEFVRRQQALTDALNSNLIDQTQYEDASFRVLADRSGVPWHTMTDDTISMEEYRQGHTLDYNGMFLTRNPETGEVSATQGSRYGGVTPATFQDERAMYDAEGNPTGLYLDPTGTLVAYPLTAEREVKVEQEKQVQSHISSLYEKMSIERARLTAQMKKRQTETGTYEEPAYTPAQVDEIIRSSYGPALSRLGAEMPVAPVAPPPPTRQPQPMQQEYGAPRGQVLGTYGFKPDTPDRIVYMIQEVERYQAMYDDIRSAPIGVQNRAILLREKLREERDRQRG